MKKILTLFLIVFVILSLLVPVCAEEFNHKIVGDTNVDGKVDAKDALEILRFSVAKISYFPDSEDSIVKQQQRDYYLAYMGIIHDVNNDGKVNAVDALNVLQYAVGKITEFPRVDLSALQTLVKPGE